MVDRDFGIVIDVPFDLNVECIEVDINVGIPGESHDCVVDKSDSGIEALLSQSSEIS